MCFSQMVRQRILGNVLLDRWWHLVYELIPWNFCFSTYALGIIVELWVTHDQTCASNMVKHVKIVSSARFSDVQKGHCDRVGTVTNWQVPLSPPWQPTPVTNSKWLNHGVSHEWKMKKIKTWMVDSCWDAIIPSSFFCWYRPWTEKNCLPTANSGGSDYHYYSPSY